MAESYEHLIDIQRQLIFWLSGLIPLALVVASGAGWILAGNALNPIDRVTRMAQQITAKALNQRLTLAIRDDEVGCLVNTFNDMLNRLQTAFEQQKHLIADTSHELRTPLTILKGDVDVALRRPRQAEDYQETLEMVQDSVDGMIKLVEELLLLARSDNNQYPLQPEPFDLSAWLADQIERLNGYAAKKRMTLSLNVPEHLPIQADPAKLGRAFLSLIDNALKYGDPSSTITVTAAAQGQGVAIAIADDGPGIAPAHLPHLFERFYRVDKSRSRFLASTGHGSGAGLGLAIVQSLVQAHGGRVEVQSDLGQEAVFTVWLPVIMSD